MDYRAIKEVELIVLSDCSHMRVGEEVENDT